MSRVAAVLVTLFACGTAGAAGDDVKFFEEKVQPVLKTHCFSCHSHTGKIKGGLTLDSRSGWEQGGDSGPALVPGEPDKSLLVKAVRYADPERKMPPKGALPADDLATLVEWVKRGAPDPRIAVKPKNDPAAWWALRPLVQPAVPGVPQGDRRNPIDRFILAKLAEKGLAPAPEADRRTLIRRLTFDLHGLPPTPEEVEAFVADADPHAYEKLVDRLLASPRYGERTARLWLDVAHYGESNGFGMDRPRLNAWPYRDYVIRSFNADKPYARFVQEQLAADVLFRNDPSLTPALGFLAAGPFNQSALAEQVDGTLCKKIALNLDRDDMVSSVAATFLSVTLHCARCHDHKFDPLTQKDYYGFQAVFAGVVRGDRAYEADARTAQQRARWSILRERVTAGESLKDFAGADRTELQTELAAAEKVLSEDAQLWQSLPVTLLADSGLPKIVPLPDGSIRLDGAAADKDTYVVVGRTALEAVAALRLEVLADDALPHRGPGRNPLNGNFALSEIRVTAAPLSAPDKIVNVPIRAAFADFNQDGWDVGKTIDRKPETGWSVHPREGQSHQAVFLFEKPVAHPGGTLFTIRLEQVHGESHVIGRLRLSVAGRTPATDRLVSPDLIVLLQIPPEKRTEDQQTRLSDALGRSAIDRKLAALPPPQQVFAVGHDLPAFRNYAAPKAPAPIHVLRRGDVTNPLEEVSPTGLAAVGAVTKLAASFALPDSKDEGGRRAAFAQWVTDERNPLAWRSIVNRAWLWHFDQGLVPSANDFGSMGIPPSHPELLDWLACEFQASGGSFKHLHRLILTSAAYRQADPTNETAAKLDADNRLLWRMNRHRLDSEQLRDALLAVTGTLDATMGGPSAMQFGYKDPNREVSPQIDYEGFDVDSPASHRRGVYRFLFRNVNDPLLEAFDAANPSLSTPKRDATVTPLQALSLLNNKFVLRQCEHLATRLQRESPELSGQIDRAFRLLYGRPPSAEETEGVAAYARKYGLARTCRVLVNANEFQFLR